MFLYIQPDLIVGNGVYFNMTLEIEGVTNYSLLIFYQRGDNNADYIFAEFIPPCAAIECALLGLS